MRLGNTRLLLMALILVVYAQSAEGTSAIRSSFDAGVEGWTADGDGKTPVWVSTDGVSGGYLQVTDGAAGSYWYFVAPAPYLGNRIRAYGKTLSYYLRQSTIENQTVSQPDVILTGGGTTLVIDTTPNPDVTWTQYVVPLDENAGWRIATLTGSAPTQAQMMATLSSLTKIAIRGEFSTLVDTGGLDDVAMTLADPVLPSLPVVSTFDSDDEGWRVVGDAQNGSSTPTYRATGGNPGGNIEAVDNATGDVWYWLAPDKFLGDVSAALGGTLSFDLKQSTTTAQFDAADVQLIGATGSLEYRHSYHPGTIWTHFDVPLMANGSWTLTGTTTSATQVQLLGVMSYLLDIRIRGEFVTGSDTGWLDNVCLSSSAGLDGDVNIDGVVDAGDIIAALRIGGGLQFPGSVTRGDVAPKPSGAPAGYGDGRVDHMDACRILRYLSGLEAVWP